MAPEILLRAEAPEAIETPLLAVALAEGALPRSLGPLDDATGGALARPMAAKDFRGKKDESLLLHPPGPARRILLLGLGPAKDLTPGRLRRVAGAAAKRARVLGVPDAVLHVVPEVLAKLDDQAAGRALAEGLGYGAWHYRDLKEPPKEPKPPLAALAVARARPGRAFRRGMEVGAAVAAGQALTRDLQVLPGNLLVPKALADHARALAGRHRFRITVLDRKAMEKEGMGALLAVAQGSAHEPRFIALEYDGAKGKPVVLVGKGVTFDSGGISIKPADRMEEMKYDMSGAAAVLGAFEMLGRLRPRVRVVGLIPSAENMPSGTAYKPGDVVRSHLGKTIEVVNTDAEGRLLLADALSWARRYEPACVVDIATLTGAIVVALGHVTTGILGTDPKLVTDLAAAGEAAGERVWELPLWDEYRELIKSDVADVKNSGGRWAGSITAGLFLREFVDGFPWAHLDIAGTAYTGAEEPDGVRGPTGVGVRLLSAFLLARAR
ncbi:MAG TPA: leucyl aminopeptidase [Gemmatimonadales bacterium]|nr:leucyl aminopeptidase [Gemmatimonadales bacterium]